MGYLADGRVDAAFGQQGTTVVPTSGIDWRIAAQGRDGTIVVAGARIVTRPAQAMAIALARFLPNGRLDRTFAGDGLLVTSARPHWAGAIELGIRPDGRIVIGTHGHAGERQGYRPPAHWDQIARVREAAGSIAVAERQGFALVQFRRNGALDRTFGSGGIAVSEVGYGVHGLALDGRGRIVAVGRTKSLLDFVVARYLPDGRRDRAFAATVISWTARWPRRRGRARGGSRAARCR